MNIQSIGSFSPVAPSAPREIAAPAAKPEVQCASFATEDSLSSGIICEESPSRSIFQVVLPQSMTMGETREETEAQAPKPSGPAGIPLPTDYSDSGQVAAFCNNVATSSLSLDDRRAIITDVLCQGVHNATSPDPTWEKATDEQIGLFVHETLEHMDALREIGEMRGMDFSEHDMEPKCGKFEPRIAQFLALPGRNDAVKWAIKEHNSAPHHSKWADKNCTKEELAESASDIVNAWRMNRRVYDKPAFGWDRIATMINEDFKYNNITVEQRDALLEAIPFQMEYEARHGIA